MKCQRVENSFILDEWNRSGKYEQQLPVTYNIIMKIVREVLRGEDDWRKDAKDNSGQTNQRIKITCEPDKLF